MNTLIELLKAFVAAKQAAKEAHAFYSNLIAQFNKELSTASRTRLAQMEKSLDSAYWSFIRSVHEEGKAYQRVERFKRLDRL